MFVLSSVCALARPRGALGYPVRIDKVGERYRFRFKMKGNLSVEQMMAPLPGGRSAQSSMKVRRLGITVATSTGTIRKI